MQGSTSDIMETLSLLLTIVKLLLTTVLLTTVLLTTTDIAAVGTSAASGTARLRDSVRAMVSPDSRMALIASSRVMACHGLPFTARNTSPTLKRPSRSATPFGAATSAQTQGTSAVGED